MLCTAKPHTTRIQKTNVQILAKQTPTRQNYRTKTSLIKKRVIERNNLIPPIVIASIMKCHEQSEAGSSISEQSEIVTPVTETEVNATQDLAEQVNAPHQVGNHNDAQELDSEMSAQVKEMRDGIIYNMLNSNGMEERTFLRRCRQSTELEQHIRDANKAISSIQTKTLEETNCLIYAVAKFCERTDSPGSEASEWKLSTLEEEIGT